MAVQGPSSHQLGRPPGRLKGGGLGGAEPPQWEKNVWTVFWLSEKCLAPSLNKHNHKLNIQYYQYVVHGIHETSPKCIQKVSNNSDQMPENPSQGIHVNELLSLGACPGTPWRPSWDGDPKKHQKTTFGDSPFGVYLWQMLVLVWWRFFICFLNLPPSIFLLPQAPAGVNFDGLGTPIW